MAAEENRATKEKEVARLRTGERMPERHQREELNGTGVASKKTEKIALQGGKMGSWDRVLLVGRCRDVRGARR